MSMRFCRECNNLLYPKENRYESGGFNLFFSVPFQHLLYFFREKKTLEYACRMCPYVDKTARDSCVYINEVIKDQS